MKTVFTIILLIFSFAFISYVIAEENSLYILNRDPFDSSTIEAILSPQKDAIVSEVKESPQFFLKATLVSGSNSIASLNSKVLKAGDIIEGYRLTAIREQEVVLINEQEEIIISMNDNPSGTDK